MQNMNFCVFSPPCKRPLFYTSTDLSPALAPSCGVCDAHETLKLCTGCKAIQYCSEGHQAGDWENHKAKCKVVKKLRSKLEIEDQKLRNDPGDGTEFEDHFNTSVGYFWHMLGTRDYMRARYVVVDALMEMSTHHSVSEALGHLLDMLRLARRDAIGARGVVPFVMIRLGKDQECYDFIKWWETVGKENHYDWADMDLPFLDVVGADVFEDVRPIAQLKPPTFGPTQYNQLGNLVALALLKAKLLVDLNTLKNAEALVAKAPFEIVESVRAHVCSSRIISQNSALMKKGDWTKEIESFEAQIMFLVKTVNRANSYFWKSLIKPYPELDLQPTAYTAQSPEEMRLFLRFSFAAWKETRGAIDIIKTMVDENFEPKCKCPTC